MSGEIQSVKALKYGESTLPESMIFKGGDSSVSRPISFTFFLISTAERRILVDSGCDTMPGFDMKHFCGPREVMKSCGLLPEDITDVVLTHAHHDHAECAGIYKNAVVYVQKDELREARRYIPSQMKVQTFEDECTVCGGVKAVKVGGHSAGSCIVTFSVKEKRFVIVGDECYSGECIEKKIPTGSSFCPEKSREFIENCKQSGDVLLLCHDDEYLPGANGVIDIV